MIFEAGVIFRTVLYKNDEYAIRRTICQIAINLQNAPVDVEDANIGIF